MQDIERIAQEAFDSSKSAHRRIDSLGRIPARDTHPRGEMGKRTGTC